MWEDTMRTVSMIFVCTITAIVLGLPIGVLMSRFDGMQRIVNPTLDIMQTMPSFVYLIPVVMLLGIGKVPGLIAVVIYAIPPIIRFTNLGIRLVPADVLEASEAFGTSAWQKMTKVQLPLALPTIMAGVNQTIMLSLAMVVIASMIGVQGLGQPVLKAIANQYFTLGMFNGLAIVGIAIIFDRASQAYGKRLQRHLEVVHG
jgi:glycine betaine/proline transport system permease protein